MRERKRVPNTRRRMGAERGGKGGRKRKGEGKSPRVSRGHIPKEREGRERTQARVTARLSAEGSERANEQATRSRETARREREVDEREMYGPTAAGHGAAAGAEGTGLGIRVTLRLDAPSISTQNDAARRRTTAAASGGGRVTLVLATFRLPLDLGHMNRRPPAFRMHVVRWQHAEPARYHEIIYIFL